VKEKQKKRNSEDSERERVNGKIVKDNEKKEKLTKVKEKYR
jgi:hypothetical protein